MSARITGERDNINGNLADDHDDEQFGYSYGRGGKGGFRQGSGNVSFGQLNGRLTEREGDNFHGDDRDAHDDRRVEVSYGKFGRRVVQNQREADNYDGDARDDHDDLAPVYGKRYGQRQASAYGWGSLRNNERDNIDGNAADDHDDEPRSYGYGYQARTVRRAPQAPTYVRRAPQAPTYQRRAPQRPSYQAPQRSYGGAW